MLLVVASIINTSEAQLLLNKGNEKYEKYTKFAQREIIKRQQLQTEDNSMLPDKLILFEYGTDRKLFTISYLEYNENGDPTIIEYFFDLWDEIGDRLEISYEYFPYYHGITGFSRSVETIYYAWRKGNYVADTKIVWDYDPFGKLTKITYFELEDDDFFDYQVITEADEHNRIISEEHLFTYGYSLDYFVSK